MEVHMWDAKLTPRFKKWINGLKNRQSRFRILAKIQEIRIEETLVGDWKPVGDGVYELRFPFGPGYRVYFAMFENKLIVLLAGGDKTTQARDIRAAKQLLRQRKEHRDED